MRTFSRCTIALLAVAASAAEMDPRLLRLIGPDAKYVSGGDVERYRASKLAGAWFGGSFIPASARFQLEIGMADGRTLYATIDDSAVQPESPDEQPQAYRGVQIRNTESGESRARLGQSISLHGDAKTVMQAIDQWTGQPAALSSLALSARTLASSYDAWAIMSKPLDHPEFGAAPRSARVEELTQAIVELRAGVRFGSVIEAHVEVDCKSSDDALALATLARYLPALFESRSGPESMAVKLVDQVVTRAQGRTAIMTLSLDERKLDEALRERAKRIIEEPEKVR